jgi:predicted amidophosphoribosyltransferase
VVEPLAQRRCPICSQSVDRVTGCRNRLCRASARHIERISAIATYSGDLADKIRRLKYDGKWGWAIIFGRLVTGWLDENREPGHIGAIVANPTYPAVGGVQHTEVVLHAAQREDLLARWPFRPELLSLGHAIRPTAGRSAAEKKAKASELRSAIRVSEPGLIVDAHVVVYDDVCTTGSQLEAVAHVLREHGAASVEGIVLARAPWRSS